MRCRGVDGEVGERVRERDDLHEQWARSFREPFGLREPRLGERRAAHRGQRGSEASQAEDPRARVSGPGEQSERPLVARDGQKGFPAFELEHAEIAEGDGEQSRIANRLQQGQRVLEETVRRREVAELLLDEGQVGHEDGTLPVLPRLLEQHDRLAVQARRARHVAVVVPERADVAQASSESPWVVDRIAGARSPLRSARRARAQS